MMLEQRVNSEETEVGKICLKNQGGFVVRMDFVYLNEKKDKERVSGSREDITLGRSETRSPGEYGMEDGAVFTVHADVVAGKDKQGSVWFKYNRDSTKVAKFTISGTTLDNELGYNGTEKE